MSVKQLLIFDSGVGGLSIFQEVINQSHNVDCHYLSDNAYFPYGELDEAQLVIRLTNLLSDFTKRYPVDLIIIACNTASTVALESLRRYFSMPVVGVVPAIKPASLLTKNNTIGLVATPATIQRKYTAQLIDEFAADKTVLMIGTTELVKLAEDKLQGKSIDTRSLKVVFKPWLNANRPPDTLVLGCTHFPLLKEEISECFNHKVVLVDSGKAIANRVQRLLGNNLNDSAVIYNAFYTKQSDTQLSLEQAFKNMGFSTFSLFE